VLRGPPRIGAIAINTSALFFTFARGAWIAGAVTLFAKYWRQIRHGLARVAAVTALVLLASWWLIPLATSQFRLSHASLPLRIQSWESGISLIVQNPLVGHGWAVGGQRVQANEPPPYNLWINVTASTGVLGAVALTGFFVRAIRVLTTSQSDVARAWFPYVAGFLVFSLGEMTFYAVGAGTIEFFVLTGAAVATSKIRVKRSDDAADFPRLEEGLSRPYAQY
jgi:O-antigen ligase